ncbi:triacylglycerol lipase 2-like [Vicia villosa]|uniref:triacylglycerol lipase 2-like n=1 Tax=Vicia villosa TaxID=3911 RepID=UPI00273B6C77|nr:triacylglycerol lipase 2-like [Vicia villosa]
MMFKKVMHVSFIMLICFLIKNDFSNQVQALSGALNGTKHLDVDNGICASSIIIHGYKCEEIQVTTEDGFILSLQRIIEGKNEVKNDAIKKQPVILQHGLILDGMIWLVNSPEQSLPLILADNGFDVWIVNTRGTRQSRRHVILDPSTPIFWNWCWDDLVKYDLPAVFNYVYSQTGQKINYVGHSLGTLLALASFSEGKLVNLVKSTALLCPTAYLSHMKTPIGSLAARFFVAEAAALFGLVEFNPKSLIIRALHKPLCYDPRSDCYYLMTSLTGHNCCLNMSSIDKFWINEPQPTSMKNMIHLGQMVRDGVLAKYNYGIPHLNFVHYGNNTPPIYNLSNIPHDLPLFISYGGQDALCDVRDVENLFDKLKFHDVDKIRKHFVQDYAHADFVMGFNVKEIVYDHIISFFNNQGNA